MITAKRVYDGDIHLLEKNLTKTIVKSKISKQIIIGENTIIPFGTAVTRIGVLQNRPVVKYKNDFYIINNLNCIVAYSGILDFIIRIKSIRSDITKQIKLLEKII